jgi:putative flippase GtrA
MKNSKTWHQLLRFAVTGVINTAIDLIVLNILINVTHSGREGLTYVIFAIISFIAAATNSYFMNKYWTFAGQGTSNKKIEISEFIIVTVFGLIVNVAVASITVTFIAPSLFPILPILKDHVNLWPSIGKLAGTAVGLMLNFLGYKFVVFEKNK